VSRPAGSAWTVSSRVAARLRAHSGHPLEFVCRRCRHRAYRADVLQQPALFAGPETLAGAGPQGSRVCADALPLPEQPHEGPGRIHLVAGTQHGEAEGLRQFTDEILGDLTAVYDDAAVTHGTGNSR
jgi:hypothetical protein